MKKERNLDMKIIDGDLKLVAVFMKNSEKSISNTNIQFYINNFSFLIV